MRCSRTGRAPPSPYTPRHPSLPIPDPVPSLPLPSHLPGPIPSIKLLKQVSQQPGRGKVSVCPSLHPHPAWPSSARPSPRAAARHGVYTLVLHIETGHMKEAKASSQPHTRAPRAPRRPRPRLSTPLVSGYPKTRQSQGLPRMVWDWACSLNLPLSSPHLRIKL